MKRPSHISALRTIAITVCATMMSYAVFASASSQTAMASQASNESDTPSETTQNGGKNSLDQTGQAPETRAETSPQQPQADPQASCSATNWATWGSPYGGSTGVTGQDRSAVRWRITSDCVMHLSGGTSPDITNNPRSLPWFDSRDDIVGIKVEGNLTLFKSNIALNPAFADMVSLTSFDTTGGQLHLAGSAAGGLFESDDALTTIKGITSWDTSKATSMASMFYFCTELTQLDLSSFNTANVEDMSNMFDSTSSLTSIAFSNNFKTSNVTSMGNMFNDCTELASLNLSTFDTRSVKSMASMFNGCATLTSLDLSNFNTANATNMSAMFQSCHSLASVNLSSFTTSKVATMRNMFSDCPSLTSWASPSSFTTPLVADMAFMFDGCTNLTTLDISNFNTSKAVSSQANLLPNGLRKLKLGTGTKLSNNAFSNVSNTISWEEMSSLDNSASHIGHIGNLRALQTRAASSSPAGSYWDARVMPSGVQLAVNANGGTTSFTPVFYDTTNGSATITVPRGNVITANKSQNIFTGWNTCADGGTSGDCRAYQPNDTITVAQGDSIPARTITLHAQWTKASSPVIDANSPVIHSSSSAGTTVDITASNTGAGADPIATDALTGSTTTITTPLGYRGTETGAGTWTETGIPVAQIQPTMAAKYTINAVTAMTDPATGNSVSTSTSKTDMLPYLQVTFNANGGTGAPADMSGFGDSGSNLLTGFAIPTDVIPTKGEHDMFAGWATSETATQPDPAYNPGNHAPTYYKHDGNSSKTLTLYAVWHEAKAPVITEVHRDTSTNHVIATGTAQPWNVIGGTPTVSGSSRHGLKVTSASVTSDNKLSVTGLATAAETTYGNVVTVHVRACSANNSSTAPPAAIGWSNNNSRIPADCSQVFGMPAYTDHPSYPYWLSGLNTEWTATNIDISGKPHIWVYVQYQDGSIDGPLMLTNPSTQGSDNSVKTCIKPAGASTDSYVCGTASMSDTEAFDGTTAHDWTLNLPPNASLSSASSYDVKSNLHINDTWQQASSGGGGNSRPKLSVISPDAYLAGKIGPPPASALPFTGGQRIALALVAIISAATLLLATFIAFRRRISRSPHVQSHRVC